MTTGHLQQGSDRPAYALDGSDADHRRLAAIAQVTAALTRSGLERTGLGHGARALDCGCGPAGALAQLAELTGGGVHVVGVDMNPDALSRAGAHLREQGIEGVTLIESDVAHLDADRIGGPVDLLHCRCFLMHQPDLDATLATLTSLLRPGGWLVALEPLTAAPLSHPPHPALADAWGILHEVVQAGGVAPGTVELLPQRLSEVGLTTVGIEIRSALMAPEIGFDLHASTVEAARVRIASLGQAVLDRADKAIAALRAAPSADHAWVATPMYLQIVAHA